MAATLPPELISAEEREARATELEREIAREWLRFSITEVLLIFVPFVTFLAVYGTSNDGALLAAAVAGSLACGLLVLYWLFRRIRPRQEEIEALRGEGSG